MASGRTRTTAVGQERARTSTAVSSKATYSKEIAKKLADTKAKLKKVNEKIGNALTAGRIEASEQLGLAQHAVESNLINAEQQLARLRKSNEKCWQDFRNDVEDSLEYLARSIKSLVDRFSDRLR